ncbi:MAG: hypothetical protein WC796_02955 [Candidatus Pacearchaeota archaeon]|jgi:hypothetical protein
MAQILEDYVANSPGRSTVRDDLVSGELRLENLLAGISNDGQGNGGVNFSSYSEKGVRLYSWDERLSLIEAIQNEKSDYFLSPNNRSNAQLVVASFERGNLARKIKETREYIAEYESGMYPPEDNTKRSLYNTKRKRRKYEQSIEIITKAEKVYANARTFIEQIEGAADKSKEQTKADDRDKRPGSARHPYRPLGKPPERFNRGVEMNPQAYREYIASRDAYYQSISQREPIEERLNHALANNPVVNACSRFIDWIDPVFDPVVRRVNNFLYEDPNYVRKPWDRPEHEIAINKITASLSKLKQRGYAYMRTKKASISGKLRSLLSRRQPVIDYKEAIKAEQ